MSVVLKKFNNEKKYKHFNVTSIIILVQCAMEHQVEGTNIHVLHKLSLRHYTPSH